MAAILQGCQPGCFSPRNKAQRSEPLWEGLQARQFSRLKPLLRAVPAGRSCAMIRRL